MRCRQVACAASLLCLLGLSSWAADKPEAKRPSFEEYLRQSAVSKEVIDRFLQGPSWAQYDPELGYILGNYLPQDGIDNSATNSTVQANGARTSFMCAGKKCRINTYGDCFIQYEARLRSCSRYATNPPAFQNPPGGSRKWSRPSAAGTARRLWSGETATE